VYQLEHLLLDLNGTLSFDHVLIEGVSERLERLRNLLDIAIITADTLGKAQPLGERLGVNIRKILQARKLPKNVNWFGNWAARPWRPSATAPMTRPC